MFEISREKSKYTVHCSRRNVTRREIVLLR